MKTYHNLRVRLNKLRVPKIDALALLARAIIEDAPDDAVGLRFNSEWVCDSVADDFVAPIILIDTCQELGPFDSEEFVLKNIQLFRDKILPAKVNRSIQNARRMISEGEALLRVEENELERCISGIYQSHVSLEKLRTEKKSAEVQEMVRLLQETRAQCAKLEKELAAKGALPK